MLKENTQKVLKTLDLQGKTALITGGNSGIGFCLAREMLFCGAHVVLACRNARRAETAVEQLQAEFPRGKAEWLPLDLADPASIALFAEEVQKKDVDIFVNNAGLFHQEQVFQVNFCGTYRLTEALLPYFEKHHTVLCNTLSLAAGFGRMDAEKGHLAVYAMSKLWLEKYTRLLASECTFPVYGVHPGIAVTGIARKGLGERVYRWEKAARFLFNDIETSALSLMILLKGSAPGGSFCGPTDFFGAFGFPKRCRWHRRSAGFETLREEIKKRGF